MNRKWGKFPRLLFLVLTILLVGSAVGFWFWVNTRGPVTRAYYNQIQVGMTLAEVEAIMGSPGDNLPRLCGHDVARDESSQLLFAIVPENVRCWKSATHEISVYYDAERRVIGKYYTRYSEVSMLQRLLDWLGI